MKNESKCYVCEGDLENQAIPTEYYHLMEGKMHNAPIGSYVCKKCIIRLAGAKKLYHISHNCDPIKEFIPRIPSSRASGEDATIPRISLSSSIEGCLTAVPWGNSQLEQMFWHDTSFLIRVYEFDMSTLSFERLVPPEYLYFTDLVRDTSSTKEYWYLDNLKPSRTYLINLLSYKEDSEEYVACQDMMDYLRRDNACESPEELFQGYFCNIEEVTYRKIPESRRSKVIRLNHPITGVNLDDAPFISKAIASVYPTLRTWVTLEKRNGQMYIKGEIDTKGQGSPGEFDTNKLLRMLNKEIGIGKILRKDEI